MSPMALTDKQKFADKISLPDERGCMRWLGSFYPNGYGRAYLSRTRVTDLTREQLAHRLSYRWFVTELSDADVVMHSCDNRWCVAPDHLTAGTQQQNMDDMHAKGRWAPYTRTRASHCHNGHEYTKDNTYTWGGKRYCKRCRLDRDRETNRVDPSDYRKA